MPQFSVSLDKVVEKLRLEVVYTPTELKNIPIYTADVNRPGLLLTGYDEYFDPTRIQIFGNAEVGYLTTLPESERRSHIHTLFAAKPPALRGGAAHHAARRICRDLRRGHSHPGRERRRQERNSRGAREARAPADRGRRGGAAPCV